MGTLFASGLEFKEFPKLKVRYGKDVEHYKQDEEGCKSSNISAKTLNTSEKDVKVEPGIESKESTLKARNDKKDKAMKLLKKNKALRNTANAASLLKKINQKKKLINAETNILTPTDHVET